MDPDAAYHAMLDRERTNGERAEIAQNLRDWLLNGGFMPNQFPERDRALVISTCTRIIERYRP